MLDSSTRSDPLRWKALIFIGLAQLMVVLDNTITNIALPSVQHDLGISDADRQWIVTAYALAFGGLLLFGGRIADLWGRKNAFLIGLVGFALASVLGGAAQNPAMMFGARALQGAFGALLAPAALSLLSVTFTGTRERAKAFGVFGAIAGGGAGTGLILGGLLTEYLNWRWTFFVNVPFAAAAFIGATVTVGESRRTAGRARLDIPGALLATLGLASLVYGFAQAESQGWTAGVTLGLFTAAAVLLALFALVELRSAAPLLPLGVVLDRTRGGVYLAMALAVTGMFGQFLFMTYFLQVVKGYSPVLTGIAFLPMVAGMLTGSTQIGPRLMPRVPARALMASGFLIAALGVGRLTQITPDAGYTTHVLPGLILLGLGLGTAFMPAMSLAPSGVRPQDTGVASAMINTSQQIGGAVGTALLSTVAVSATARFTPAHTTGAGASATASMEALVHGYTTAFTLAAGLITAAAVVAFLLINAPSPGRDTTGTKPNPGNPGQRHRRDTRDAVDDPVAFAISGSDDVDADESLVSPAAPR